jgi:hypothetical protein
MCFEEKHFPIQKTLMVSIDPSGAGVTITTKKALKKDNYLSIRIPADLQMRQECSSGEWWIDVVRQNTA